MGALIDASVLIAAERGSLDIDAALGEHRGTEFALSSVTASELLHGVHRAKTSTQKLRREAYVEALLTMFPVVAFDLVAARSHARLWATLASKGVAVGAHDLVIAATAISRGMEVATRDERSFPRIPGLSLIRW
jgi:predicted nucleic acid-binding protein